MSTLIVTWNRQENWLGGIQQKEMEKQKAQHREGERQFCVLAEGKMSGAALAAEEWQQSLGVFMLSTGDL